MPFKGIGILLGNFFRIAYPLAEYGSLVAVFFNFDPSGHILRFTQVLKYIIRVRFFKIKYGIVLESFLREAGLSIETPSKKDLDYIRLNSNGSKEKYTSERVPLDVFDACLLKTILYILSCLIKLALNSRLRKFKKRREISEFWTSLIYRHQYFHHVLLQLYILDLSYYGFRTSIHSSFGILRKAVTEVLILFATLELC